MDIWEKETRELLSNSIFKYSPFKNVERTLKNLTLGFSQLSNFNDVNESEYRLVHFFHSVEDEKELFEGKKSPFDKIQRLSSEYLNSVRITCFSHSATNSLMWAHYADNHQGVSFCFGFDGKNNPFDPIPTSWGNVIYSSLVPEIKIFQDKTTEGMLPMLLTDVILTKSQDWEYEKEIRFFRKQDENFMNYNPNALRGIIVGRRTPNKQIQLLENLIDEYNKKHSMDARVLYAHRIATKFNLGIHSNKSFRDSSERSFNAKIPVLKEINSPPLTSISSDRK